MQSITKICLLMLLLTSCKKETINPSVNSTKKYVDIKDFSSLDLSGAFLVDIAFGSNTDSIVVETNENLHNYISFSKIGKTLAIKLKDNIEITGQYQIKIKINSKLIDNFNVTGSNTLSFANELISDNVIINCTGSSIIKANINSKLTKVQLSGSSEISIDGKMSTLDILQTGSSNIKALNLQLSDLSIDLAGSAVSSIAVFNSVIYQGSGSSILYYLGNPSFVSKNLTGSAKLIKL